MKFCGECGSRARSRRPRAPVSAPTAERRLVSVLFADLVGFTTASEGRDAEDTRELLTRYFDTLAHDHRALRRHRREVHRRRRHGGLGRARLPTRTTPSAPCERRSSSSRRCRHSIPRLQARAGVLTGEAAVTLGATDQGMVAGDLVNTASRIQSAAEPGTVLVGETTKRTTEAAVVYADAGLHEMKGKGEPTQLWRASRVVAARKGEGRAVGARGAVRRPRPRASPRQGAVPRGCRRRAAPASSTVIGVAGIGKSRLAWEFEKYLDGLADRRLVAPRPLPLVRRRRRVLGARRDGAGARRDLRGRGRDRARSRSSTRRYVSTSPIRASAAGSSRASQQLLGLDRADRLGPRRPVLGLAALLRAARRPRHRGARLRGSPLGRLRLDRVRRAPARVEQGTADLRPRALPSRAARAPPRLRQPGAQRGHARARPALRMRRWTRSWSASCRGSRRRFA